MSVRLDRLYPISDWFLCQGPNCSVEMKGDTHWIAIPDDEHARAVLEEARTFDAVNPTVEERMIADLLALFEPDSVGREEDRG